MQRLTMMAKRLTDKEKQERYAAQVQKLAAQAMAGAALRYG
jgi:hypothetical protein